MALAYAENLGSLTNGDLVFQDSLSTRSLASSRCFNVTSFMDGHFR